MHELSITQQILDIAISKASEVGAVGVKQIVLVIGEMSNVMDDSIQFYFDFLSQDSIARGAQLSFQRIPTRVLCLCCKQEFTPAGVTWECPRCHECDVEVISGNEFFLQSIEVV